MKDYIIPSGTIIYASCYPSNGELHRCKVIHYETDRDGLWYFVQNYNINETEWIHESQIEYDHRKSKLKFI